MACARQAPAFYDPGAARKRSTGRLLLRRGDGGSTEGGSRQRSAVGIGGRQLHPVHVSQRRERLGRPQTSVGTDAAAYTAASLAGNVFGSLLLVFGISWIVVQFRKGRTQRIKVQTFFITCTALEGVRLLSMLSIGATQRYVEKARLAEEAKGADTAP